MVDMGTLLNVTCTECGTVGEQVDGAVMRGPLVRCSKCGKTRVEPIEAVGDAELVFEASDTSCDCGGRFSDDAPIRCRACRSTSVTVEAIGIAD